MSDLHVGDGSASDDFAYDLEFSKLLNDIDGAGRKNVELVILGDGLEILESEMVRNLNLVDFSTLCTSLNGDVIEMIYNKHKLFFDALSNFAKKHKITYVVGNHDYYISLNEKLKNVLTEKIHSQNFQIVTHFYDESIGIFAQHGNQYDVTNSFSYTVNGHLIPPIGDYVTRRTMVQFEPLLKLVNLPEEVARDYDNVRPLSHTMDWLKYIMSIYELPVDLIDEWKKSFSATFRSEEAKTWIHVKFPRTYWLSDFFTQKSGWFDFGRRIVKFMDMLFRVEDTNYLKRRAERILNAYWNPEWKLKLEDVAGYSEEVPELDYSCLKMVLFGHNHMPGLYTIPTPAGLRYYANTGTWRPLVEKSRGKYGQIAFHKKVEMNYVIVEEKDDELVVETNLISRIRIPK